MNRAVLSAVKDGGEAGEEEEVRREKREEIKVRRLGWPGDDIQRHLPAECAVHLFCCSPGFFFFFIPRALFHPIVWRPVGWPGVLAWGVGVGCVGGLVVAMLAFNGREAVPGEELRAAVQQDKNGGATSGSDDDGRAAIRRRTIRRCKE